MALIFSRIPACNSRNSIIIRSTSMGFAPCHKNGVFGDAKICQTVPKKARSYAGLEVI
jgi:hypothetical protein